MNKKPKPLRLLTIFIFAAASSCGVKGPPLPPVADTPQASDRMDGMSTRPSPTPTPSKTPSAKKKGTSTGR